MENTIDEYGRAIAKEQLEVVVPSIENVSNRVLALTVSNGIKYEFYKSFLVKQMDAQLVKKMQIVFEETGEVDEEGNAIKDAVKKEVDVESTLREGVILKVPASLKSSDVQYNIGDRIVYRNVRATDFDLLPGSALVDPFDVLCKNTVDE